MSDSTDKLKFDREDGIDGAIDYLTDYMNTYKDQANYQDYTPYTFVQDIIYGLGVAMSEDHKFANGYRDFKKKLVDYLEHRDV